MDSLSEDTAWICDDLVYVYDSVSQEVRKQPLPVYFGGGVFCLDLTPTTLLCLGQYPASTEVYELDLTSFRLTLQSSLCIPKCSPGAIQWTTDIYLFGGRNGLMTVQSTCERMDMRTKQWSLVRNQMNYPRVYFTPCLCTSLIYLLSANEAACRCIETFDPQTQVFTLLPVTLPPELMYGNSISFIDRNRLYLITPKQIACSGLGTDLEFRIGPMTAGFGTYRHPRILHFHLQIPSYKKKIDFSFITLSITKVVHIP